MTKKKNINVCFVFVYDKFYKPHLKIKTTMHSGIFNKRTYYVLYILLDKDLK